MTRVLFESNRTVAWETALEELLRRSMVFSSVLYLVRIKDIKKVQGTFLQGFKKQMSKYTASRTALVPGKGVLPWKEKPTLASQEGSLLIYIYIFFNMDILCFWSVNPLMIKADVQCTFDRP